MKRMSCHFDNDWRRLRDGAQLDLLQLSVAHSRYHIGIGVSLAGFGVGLTYWKRIAREWQPSTWSWEPIETDGWGGVPEQGVESGREHGA